MQYAKYIRAFLVGYIATFIPAVAVFYIVQFVIASLHLPNTCGW